MLFACCAAFLFTVAAAADDPPSLTAGGARPGPVSILEVTVPDADERSEIIRGTYNVSNVQGEVVTVYATPAERRQLEAAGYAVVEIGQDPSPPQFLSDAKALGSYHSYAGITDALNAYAAAYPNICRLFTVGQSVQGRELWGLLITDSPDVEEDEPEFKYVSTMHGDEPLGTELCLYLIDLLLNDYSSDARITDLVDTTAIWIMPVMNPDGLERGSRFNSNGHDLNRTFPAYPADFTGTFYYGEPLGDDGVPVEVGLMMNWTADNSFVLSANFHTGALVVNYPYDDDGKPNYSDAPSPDDLLFEDISRRYSIENTPMWNSYSFSDGITNGCDWYSIDGGMQDWHYRYVSCNDVTIELSNIKKPSAVLLPGLWDDNRNAMLAYMEAVHIGVRGVVTDGLTGEPLLAQVMVAGNSHPVFTDPDVGDYHRMLLPGTYDLEISAQGGYFAHTVQAVEVGEGAATRIDVELFKTLTDPDIDGDGTVGVVDIQHVVNKILGYSVPYSCDLDGGGLSATDLQLIINIVLGRL